MATTEQKKILLVDDEAIIAIAEARTIAKFGYEVITANSGEKAIELATGENHIDLILMDIDLGKGMNGPGAALQILKRRSLPIVFLTSHSEREMVEKVKGITRYGYVIKNSGDFVLQSSIEMALELFEAHQNSKEKEEKLEKAQTLAHIGSWTWDIKHNNLVWSDEMYRVFGIAKDSFTGSLPDVIAKAIHPDDRFKVEQSNASTIQDKKPIPLEYRVIWPDGSIHTVWAEGGELVVDDGGNPISFSGFVQDITERKRAEDALQESENRLKRFVEASFEGIGVIENGTILEANEQLATMLRCSVSDLLGNNVMRFVASELRDKVQTLMRSDDDQLAELLAVAVDGTIFPVEVRGRSVFYHGHHVRMVVLRDLTERKRAEGAIHETEERLRTIVEGTPQLFFYTQDADANTTYVSPTVEHITGHSVGAWTKRRDWFITDSAVNQGAKERTRAHLRGQFTEEPILLEVRHAGGHPILLEVFEYPVTKNGKVVGLQGVAHDVTQTKQAEKALQESEERYRELVATMQDGVYRSSHDGKFLEVNPAMVEILGYSSKEELMAIDIKKQLYFAAEDRESAALEEKLEEMAVFRLKKKDGSEIWVEDHGRHIVDEAGNILYHEGVLRDVTERKRAEERIQYLFAEKELLLQEVHHRIKNNMNTMMSLLSLQAGSMKSTEAAAALNDAGNRMRSMGVLYDKLYRSSAFHNLSVKEYLSTLIDEAVGNFPNSRMIATEKDLEDFSIDVRRISPLGILVNEILTNTMKHAFVGRDSGKITICASLKEKRATFIIQDNGIGIPESIAIHSAESFGLKLIGMLAQQIEGTIRIERGNGTKFVLEFEV